MNPFSRFFEFIGNPSHSRTLGILAVLVIALAIPLTVQIAQKQQELRQQAAGTCETIELGTFCTNISNTIPETSCQEVNDATASCPPGPDGKVSKFKCTQQVCTNLPTPPPNDVIADCRGRGGECISGPSCTASGGKILQSCPSNQVCCARPAPSNPSTTTCPSGNGWTGEGCTQGNPNRYLKGNCQPGQCQINGCYKNPSGDNYCWYNGVTVDDQVIQQCYPYPDADVRCNNGASLPDCTNSSGTCQAAANSCNITSGTWTLDKLANGSTSCTKKPNTACTLASPAVCPTGKICNTSNQCVDSQASSGIQSVVVLSNLTLHGLGTAGDIKNPSQRPTTPQGGKRKAVVELINIATGATTQATQVTPQLNSNGTFTVSSSFNNIPTANYTVKLKVDGFLKKSYGAVTVSSGQTVTLGNPLTLVAADLVVDSGNRVDTLDYNTLSSCFGQSGSGSCSLSDLDDSGTVDLFDFNLLLREFGQVGD